MGFLPPARRAIGCAVRAAVLRLRGARRVTGAGLYVPSRVACLRCLFQEVAVGAWQGPRADIDTQ